MCLLAFRELVDVVVVVVVVDDDYDGDDDHNFLVL